MKKICFVCIGNTCRSPIAEKIFNDMIKQKGIKGIKATSAGLCCQTGQNTDIKAKRALKALGYNIGAKKSCAFDATQKNTIFIAMTDQLRDSVGTKNMYSFSDFGCNQIQDPYGYGQDVYDKTAKLLEQNIANLIQRLQRLLAEQ